MPKPLTERPLSETMQTVYRLVRQTDLSSRLTDKRKLRIKGHLNAALKELQEADQGKR